MAQDETEIYEQCPRCSNYWDWDDDKQECYGCGYPFHVKPNNEEWDNDFDDDE